MFQIAKTFVFFFINECINYCEARCQLTQIYSRKVAISALLFYEEIVVYLRFGNPRDENYSTRRHAQRVSFAEDAYCENGWANARHWKWSSHRQRGWSFSVNFIFIFHHRRLMDDASSYMFVSLLIITYLFPRALAKKNLAKDKIRRNGRRRGCRKAVTFHLLRSYNVSSEGIQTVLSLNCLGDCDISGQ